MKKTRISGKIKYRFEHSSEDSRNELRMSALQGWKWREKREFLWIRMIMERESGLQTCGRIYGGGDARGSGTAVYGVCV